MNQKWNIFFPFAASLEWRFFPPFSSWIFACFHKQRSIKKTNGAQSFTMSMKPTPCESGTVGVTNYTILTGKPFAWRTNGDRRWLIWMAIRCESRTSGAKNFTTLMEILSAKKTSGVKNFTIWMGMYWNWKINGAHPSFISMVFQNVGWLFVWFEILARYLLL